MMTKGVARVQVGQRLCGYIDAVTLCPDDMTGDCGVWYTGSAAKKVAKGLVMIATS